MINIQINKDYFKKIKVTHGESVKEQKVNAITSLLGIRPSQVEFGLRKDAIDQPVTYVTFKTSDGLVTCDYNTKDICELYTQLREMKKSIKEF